MKIQLAELRNMPVRDVVTTLAEATTAELVSLTKELAIAKQIPIVGTVVAFLKSEESNPDSKFRQACNAVGIPPTKRQASKWMHKKGLAYKQGRYMEAV